MGSEMCIRDRYGISRQAADAFALRSHQRAATAIDEGKFKEQIVPITVQNIEVKEGKKVSYTHTVKEDEGVRRDTSLEGLAKLRPVFKKGGVVTAGNASQTSDGVAFLLIVSEAIVKSHNLTPIARLIACAVAVSYTHLTLPTIYSV